jgi:6-phosphofructokinase 1
VPFDELRFMDMVQENVEKYDNCVICVSEGLRWPSGRFVSETGSTDAFGHHQLGGVAPTLAELVKNRLGYKYHWAVADYLQRSARHIASGVDVEQAYAMGKAAVEMALGGGHGHLPIIVRESDAPYEWRVGKAPLDRVANVERKLPKRYITPDGFNVTAAGRRYLEPLIQGEDYPPYKNGLPYYVTLKNELVPKKLEPWEPPEDY